MRRLGTDYFDILWCHDVEFGDEGQILNEALPVLFGLRQEGGARVIGVSGFPLETLVRYAMNSSIDAVLSYCHYMLSDTSLEKYIGGFRDRGIATVNAAPLGMGLFTAKPLPAWHPASGEQRIAAAKARAYCEARGASLEKLALQFAVACPGIVSTLVGCVSRREVEDNVRATQDPIDVEVLDAVREILQPQARSAAV